MPDDPLRELGQLEEEGFRRLAARLALLRAYARCREEEGLSDAKAQEDIAEAFEQRTASVDDWVYDVYDSVTARTLRRWARQFRDEGLQGLIDKHGRRSERSYDSYFGAGSELRKIALHYPERRLVGAAGLFVATGGHTAASGSLRGVAGRRRSLR